MGVGGGSADKPQIGFASARRSAGTRQLARATEVLKPASLRSQQASGSRSRTRQQARGSRAAEESAVLSPSPAVDSVELLPKACCRQACCER